MFAYDVPVTANETDKQLDLLISSKWCEEWIPPFATVGINLLIVIFSVVLAVYGPIKKIYQMSIADMISEQ